MTVQVRYQMVLPQWLKEAAQREAEKKGISLAEYIKDLIKHDVERHSRPTSPS